MARFFGLPAAAVRVDQEREPGGVDEVESAQVQDHAFGAAVLQLDQPLLYGCGGRDVEIAAERDPHDPGLHHGFEANPHGATSLRHSRRPGGGRAV